MTKVPKQPRKRKQDAPGQFYGYSLQITRVVAHLLRARPGQSVSLEHLDDVATSGPGSTSLEQTKSGLAHNPVSDRSIGLWKTLHIWIDAIRAGALEQDTRFVLYTAQPHKGAIAQRLHSTTSRIDAISLIEDIRNDFWGPPPDRALRSGIPEELGVHVNAVLAATNEVLARLIQSFSFETGSGAPNDDLIEALREKAAISEAALGPVLKHLLGWAKHAIDKSIESGKPPILAWEDFHRQLVGAAKKFDRLDSVLPSNAITLSPTEVRRELRGRVYVKQLEAIECSESELVQAVNDYLRASVDRTAWSERGDVVESSFDDFEDALKRAWINQKKRVEIEQSTRSNKDIGNLLLAYCMAHQLPLQGMQVPAYFIPGSYHSLADDRIVFWHPQFLNLISSPGESCDASAAKEDTVSHGEPDQEKSA